MEYTKSISQLLAKIEKTNQNEIKSVEKLLKKKIDQGGMLFVFGSGHSSILCEEAFHRAGGLIPVYPLFLDALTPHVSPKIAGPLERLPGIAPILLERAKASSEDILFIASQSGINSAAIDMALECQKKKIPTVAFTSLTHSKSTVSRHPSGKKLFELTTHVLDNCCPVGDGVLEMDGVRVSAGSTIANSFLYGWIISEICKTWTKEGKDLPVYKSANLPGGDKHNEKIEKKYRSRIPLL